MNIALIIAGGTGSRTNKKVPKQFITINDKPLIIHTLEKFQFHRGIDKIIVVCLNKWEEFVAKYAEEYVIDKLSSDAIIVGGESNQESILKGLEYINEFFFDENNIIIIHAANRPFVSGELISKIIDQTKKSGNAVSATPITDGIIESNDFKVGTKVIDRNNAFATQTPQGIKLKLLNTIHRKASTMNITKSVSTATLLIETGYKVNFVTGSNVNMKITHEEDFLIAKELFNVVEE